MCYRKSVFHNVSRKSVYQFECMALFHYQTRRHIEDIYFFEGNTKYISSSVLKTLEFS